MLERTSYVLTTYGPFLTNGFTMINLRPLADELQVNIDEAERERLESIWGRNNRLRELSLQMIEPGSPATSLGTIQLDDRVGLQRH